MARKPNYKFEKLERERQKAAKKAAKRKAKLETRDQGEEPDAASESLEESKD